MLRTILTISLFVFAFPLKSFSDENARIKITLLNVTTTPAIETQIYVYWGARLKYDSSRLKRYTFKEEGNRSIGKISYKTDTEKIDRNITSFIIYGVIREQGKKIIKYVPAKFIDIKEKSPSQIQVELNPRPTFEEAFLDSYPLEFMRDRGFLESDNVRPVLRSLRLMIDYAGEIDLSVSNEVWNRIHTFFQVNLRFFRRGGSNELSEVLEYLKTYTSASRSDGVARFYAEFLNGLVSDVRGIDVFDEPLTDYIHGQLMQLYDVRLKECFSESDISIMRFLEIGQFEKSIVLVTKILEKLDEEYLKQIIKISPNNLYSVLLQATICGQEFYVDNNRPNASRMQSDSGASFLVERDIGRDMISQFLRVCKIMIDNGFLSLDSTGNAYEIAKFYMAYKKAMGG